jgi:zinc protease
MFSVVFLAGLASAADDPFATAPVTEVLPNGLTVMVEKVDRTDTVALFLHYGVGGRDEAPGEYGCAHLFEHLMFEGSANVGQNMFDEWLTAAGGSNNAYTSDDETAYHMTFPSGALDLALFLESDRMGFLDAGLTAENLDNQASVVLQERAEGYAEPNGRDWDALARLFFPEGHPYHVPVIGTVADIEGFTLDAVRSFWQRHYRPRNAVLSIVGNVETDEALAAVRHWFSDVPDPGPAEARVESAELTLSDRRLGLLQDDVEERTVYLSWRTVPLGHADEPALDLLSNILSYGRGTRLDDRLEYNSNLATDENAMHWPAEVDGQFIAYASSDRTALKKLTRIIQKEVDAVAATPPTEAELERARRAYRGYLLDSLEDIEDRASILVQCHRMTGDANCLGAEYGRYEAVTTADIQRVADTYLGHEGRVALSVVPREVGGALSGSTPVELP